MDRDSEMILDCEVVPADYPGMKKLQVRLEKDEAWDPKTVLKTFFDGELKPDIWVINGMTFGEAKKYIDSISH